MIAEIEQERSRGRRVGFYVGTVAAVLLVLGALFPALPFTVVSWFSPEALQEMYPEEPAIDIHRFHLFGVVILTWLLFLPIAVQLIRPVTKLAAAALGLANVVVLITIDVAARVFDPLEIVALALLGIVFWLHPGRDNASLRPWRRRPLALAAIGALGWLAYAAIELNRQLTGFATDPHVEFGHFGVMAQVSILVVLGAVVGSSAMQGRRFAAALAAAAGAYLGLASIVYPGHTSSLGVGLGVAAIVWAALYAWSVFADSARQDMKAPLAAGTV